MPRNCAIISFTSPIPEDKPLKVVAPIGAAGNHVRWLLFLNLDVKCEIGIDERHYVDASGPDWPPYSEYVKPDFVPSELLLNDIQYVECCQKRQLTDVASRAEFIKTEIYPKDRTWHNWLNYEWRSREEFSKIIAFAHEHKNRPDDTKRLILTMSSALAMRSYVKLNSSLNNLTIPGFLNQIEKFNKVSNSLPKSDTHLVVNADNLWQETLPVDFYNTITQWAGCSNEHYEQTNEIHRLWFNLHQQAEQDILKYLRRLYGG